MTQMKNYDPHSWLSPKLAKLQAQLIYTELLKHLPKDIDFLTHGMHILHNMKLRHNSPQKKEWKTNIEIPPI